MSKNTGGQMARFVESVKGEFVNLETADWVIPERMRGIKTGRYIVSIHNGSRYFAVDKSEINQAMGRGEQQ